MLVCVCVCVRVILSCECMCALGGAFWRKQLGCSFGGVPVSWANNKILAIQVAVRGRMLTMEFNMTIEVPASQTPQPELHA